jgi:hypothetical protein
LIDFESHLGLVLLVFPFPFAQDRKSMFQILDLQGQALIAAQPDLLLFFEHLNARPDSLLSLLIKDAILFLRELLRN